MEQKLRIVRLLETLWQGIYNHGKRYIPGTAAVAAKNRTGKDSSSSGFATMFVGDSQTMTSEAAILGTPALKCNSFAHKLSVPDMLEKKYGLCYAYQPEEFEAMYEKAEELVKASGVKQIWHGRRERFLADSIDPTEWLVRFIENFPEGRGGHPNESEDSARS